jgi:AraC family transcriptional regulator of adaptative response / DNA-3-methyladenine glycosylase II
LAAVGEDALQALGLTRSRAATVVLVARAVASGELRLDPGSDPEAALAALLAIPGVGPWTAELVAMRALHWPDAFPHADLGLRRALGATDRREMLARAERWRPWRSYAVMHLWAMDGGGG